MNTTQAMILLNNGVRKYGYIFNEDSEETIRFIPKLDLNNFEESKINDFIEYIPKNRIYSIDTFLK